MLLSRPRPPRRAFARFLELAPDGVLIIDERGEILLVNRQVEDLFGYTREELLGQPAELLIPERYRPQHPAHGIASWSRQRPERWVGDGVVRPTQRRQ